MTTRMVYHKQLRRDPSAWLLRRFWLPGLTVLLGCAGDCALDRCPNIPPGAMPEPHGSFVRRIQDAQAAKAEADDFVVYKHEWFLGGTELGPYGRYHLQQIAQRLPEVPFPVLIQGTTDGQLNETRRQQVVKALTAAGINDAEQRVVVGYPEAEGLYGDEAPILYGQMVQGGAGFGGMLGGPMGGMGGRMGGMGSGNFLFGGGRSLFRGGLGFGFGAQPFF